MTIPITNSWQPIIDEVAEKDNYKRLREFLIKEYEQHTIYPEADHVWTAFQWTPYDEVKVVILGQDPYHGPGQAHGLSFSVQPSRPIPPSLRNIYKELQEDLGIEPVQHGYLKHWAKQGVLLLNAVLTVRAHQAHSHRGKGWEELTDYAVASLNERQEPIVFILWGAAAGKKRGLIDEDIHVVLTAPHPSPLSAYRGFFGSKPFSQTNDHLIRTGQKPINWQLPGEV